MNINIQSIESGGFNTLAAALAEVARIEPSVILREEARQFFKRALMKTPPFKIKGSGDSTSDFAIGKRAVARDLKRAMKPIRPEDITHNKSLADAIRRHDRVAFDAIAKNIKTGPMAGARAVPFSKSIHTSLRDRRGHVNAKNRKVYVFEVAQWEGYRQKEFDAVGILKGGWNAGILNPQLSRGGKVASVPAYVKRHGTKFSVASIQLDKPNAFVDVTNKGVKYPGYAKLIRETMQVREKAMMTKMQRLFAGKATNLGFMTIEAKGS